MASYILIIEDEKDLVSILEYNLQKSGFLTRSSRNGKDGLGLAMRDPKPQLIILDLMLPDLPGTEICRQLKNNAATKNIPVMMVTAKGEEIDRVVGFELGADDYVVKPFSIRELVLRVKALLRRSGETEGEAMKLNFGPIEIDAEAHKVWVDRNEINLTLLEFKLLKMLLARKGRVQTRDKLLDDVWGIQAAITTRTVDTHVIL